MLQKVDFSQATDAELQIAGKFAGIDEMGRIGAGLVEADILNPKGREMLITALKECGYKLIQIDPNNRITNGHALTPFEVALPVE
jgi:hypothetical protein